MLEWDYSIEKPEIKEEEKEAYYTLISGLSHYVDGHILEEIKKYYK